MDDGASAGIVDQRDIGLDRVIGFHLEAPPIGPHRRADAVLAQDVRDLVAFDGVVEGGDLVTELLGHIHDDGHLVGAVRSEEHTSELQSLMRISYAVFCLKKKNNKPERKILKRKSEYSG